MRLKFSFNTEGFMGKGLTYELWLELAAYNLRNDIVNKKF